MRKASWLLPGGVLFILHSFSGGVAMAQEKSAHPRDVRMHRVLAGVVETALPGATVNWDSATVVHPDGTADQVMVGCYREDTMDGQHWMALSVEFPERTRAAVDGATSVGDAVAGGYEPRLAFAAVEPDGAPAGVQVTFLEPGGKLASCSSLEFREPFASLYASVLEGISNATGPVVDVELTALYEHEGQLASVVWGGVYDPHRNRYRLLIPAGGSLESGEMETFQLEPPEGDGILRLRGVYTGKVLTFRCPSSETCLVPPTKVLSWLKER